VKRSRGDRTVQYDLTDIEVRLHMAVLVCKRPSWTGPCPHPMWSPHTRPSRDTSPLLPVICYTSRAISQNCTGVQQYGQIFMLAVQRSHAS